MTIFWFRRDLRIEDNASLYAALKNSENVLPVFIFDTDILHRLNNKSDKRVDFIHQALQALQNKLTEVGTSLTCFYGKPIDAFRKLLGEYAVKAVYTNTDYEPAAISRDKEIEDFLKTNGIAFHAVKDHVIFEKNEVLKPDETPYTIYTPYSRVWKQRLKEQPIKQFPSEKGLKNFIKIKVIPIPSLKDIGFTKTDLTFAPPLINTELLKHYHDTRNIPSVNGTSMLGTHLRFGTLSIRKLALEAIKLNEQFLNELIWRDFFIAILYHFPYVVNSCFKEQYNRIEWRNNEKEFKNWCEGKTGYPIVDAGMRQLNETGFMHNRVRMITASFLVKNLLIDWRWGEAYFAEKLMDFELASNNGNWQWAAGCGCDAAPYFRIFNPSEQVKKFDPQLKYIKQWVPEFESLEYCGPIVDYKLSRNRVLQTYKKALGRL